MPTARSAIAGGVHAMISGVPLTTIKPELGGYPLVLPVDVPNTPNLTWTVTKPVAAGVQIEGFMS
jgi:hypothetical protein